MKNPLGNEPKKLIINYSISYSFFFLPFLCYCVHALKSPNKLNQPGKVNLVYDREKELCWLIRTWRLFLMLEKYLLNAGSWKDTRRLIKASVTPSPEQ